MFLETVCCAKHAWFTVLTCSVSTREGKKLVVCDQYRYQKKMVENDVPYTRAIYI